MSTVQLETIDHVIGGVDDRRRFHPQRAGLRPRDRPRAAARGCSPRRSDVDAAVQAAKAAFESWATSPWSAARGSCSPSRADRSSTRTSWRGSSRPSTARRSRTPRARSCAGWRSSSTPAGSGSTSRASSPTRSPPTSTLHSFRQPLGVCAGITPFNLPIMVPMWMHPMAIATGNTFVLKPSERDPSVSNYIAPVRRGRAAGRRLQRRPRRQGRRRRAARSPGRGGDQLRRLDPDREVHPRARPRPPASACRRWAAPRTTRS